MARSSTHNHNHTGQGRSDGLMPYHNGYDDDEVDDEVTHNEIDHDEHEDRAWVGRSLVHVLFLLIALAFLAALVVFVLLPMLDMWLNPPPPIALPPASQA